MPILIIILVDLQMPEMDGYEATLNRKMGAGKGEVPIVAMTAHTIKGNWSGAWPLE